MPEPAEVHSKHMATVRGAVAAVTDGQFSAEQAASLLIVTAQVSAALTRAANGRSCHLSLGCANACTLDAALCVYAQVQHCAHKPFFAGLSSCSSTSWHARIVITASSGLHFEPQVHQQELLQRISWALSTINDVFRHFQPGLVLPWDLMTSSLALAGRSHNPHACGQQSMSVRLAAAL